MKLATYEQGPGIRIGIVVGDALIDSGFAGSMSELIANWDANRAQLDEA